MEFSKILIVSGDSNQYKILILQMPASCFHDKNAKAVSYMAALSPLNFVFLQGIPKLAYPYPTGCTR